MHACRQTSKTDTQIIHEVSFSCSALLDTVDLLLVGCRSQEQMTPWRKSHRAIQPRRDGASPANLSSTPDSLGGPR